MDVECANQGIIIKVKLEINEEGENDDQKETIVDRGGSRSQNQG